MVRSLKAIEIAEGALLADIAVIFHLFATYLPVGGGIFRLLIFVVFCVLALRRGLYVGIMALCVALFIVSVLVGMTSIPLMLLQVTGGLFLGVAMQRRMHHIPLLLLGITCGSFAMYGLLLLVGLLTGLPVASYVRSLRISYQWFLSIASTMSVRIGLGSWWLHQAYPLFASLLTLLVSYWWAMLYIAIWVALCPIVCAVYLMTNSLVRLLGYEVRPFPGNRINKILRRMRRRLINLVRKHHIVKTSGDRA